MVFGLAAPVFGAALPVAEALAKAPGEPKGRRSLDKLSPSVKTRGGFTGCLGLPWARLVGLLCRETVFAAGASSAALAGKFAGASAAARRITIWAADGAFRFFRPRREVGTYSKMPRRQIATAADTAAGRLL